MVGARISTAVDEGQLSRGLVGCLTVFCSCGLVHVTFNAQRSMEYVGLCVRPYHILQITGKLAEDSFAIAADVFGHFGFVPPCCQHHG